MTLEEAQKVLDIMGTADSGCSYCSNNLAERFAKAFPEFVIGPREDRQRQASWSDDPEDTERFNFYPVTLASQATAQKFCSNCGDEVRKLFDGALCKSCYEAKCEGWRR